MPDEKGVLDHQNELIAMPEYRRIMRIKTLGTSFEVFHKNYAEFKKAVDFFCKDPRFLNLVDVRNRKALHEFHIELTRLLHNFVASAISLRDHCRNQFRELYEAGNLFPDYQAEIDTRFMNDPIAQFVEGLRVYCLHLELPPVATKTSYQQGARDFGREILLPTEPLLRWNGWKKGGIGVHS